MSKKVVFFILLSLIVIGFIGYMALQKSKTETSSEYLLNSYTWSGTHVIVTNPYDNATIYVTIYLEVQQTVGKSTTEISLGNINASQSVDVDIGTAQSVLTTLLIYAHFVAPVNCSFTVSPNLNPNWSTAS